MDTQLANYQETKVSSQFVFSEIRYMLLYRILPRGSLIHFFLKHLEFMAQIILSYYLLCKMFVTNKK